MKNKTFNIQTAKGPQETTGQIMNLDVGGKRHKFAVHRYGSALALTDYRTGFRVATLDDIAILRMIRLGHHAKTSNREAATEKLAEIIARAGLEKVRATLAAHPTLNA